MRRLSGVHKDRLPKREVRFRRVETAIEAMPKWLDEVGQEEFKRLAPQLIDNGLLTHGNVICLAKLAAAHARGVHAEEDVALEGTWIEVPIYDKKGDLVGESKKINPMLKEARDCSMEYKAWCQEFGLTPSASAKVVADPPEEKRDDFDEFLVPEESAAVNESPVEGEPDQSGKPN